MRFVCVSVFSRSCYLYKIPQKIKAFLSSEDILAVYGSLFDSIEVWVFLVAVGVWG